MVYSYNSTTPLCVCVCVCVCLSCELLLFFVQHELREEVIEKVKWNISRDSPEDKLRDLLEWMKAVKRDTVHSVSSSLPSSPILSTVYP